MGEGVVETMRTIFVLQLASRPGVLTQIAGRDPTSSSTCASSSSMRTVERERHQALDAEAALERLESEDEVLRQELDDNAERRFGADQRVATADAIVAGV